MKRLHKDQRGLTILELVIVILLTGLITTAITTTFFQVFNTNARIANHMIAVSQVQHAGKIVSEDILEAQDMPDPEDGEFLILGWTASNGTTTHTHNVTYTLESGELWRTELVDGDSTMTRVAEHINLDQTSCNLNYPVVVFTVTATVGAETWARESETRVYRIQPRPWT